MSKVKKSDIDKVQGVTEARMTQINGKGLPPNSIDAAETAAGADICTKLEDDN